MALALAVAASAAGCGGTPSGLRHPGSHHPTVGPGGGPAPVTATSLPGAPLPGAPVPGAPLPGAAVLATTLADARRAGWVRVDTVGTLPADQGGREEATQVSGPGQGRQRFSIGGVALQIVVLGRRTWVRGGRRAIELFLTETAAAAGPLAGHWLLLVHGDAAYASVTAGVDLGDVVGELVARGPTTAAAGVLDGRPVTVLTTRVGGRVAQTLDVTTGPTPLPLRAVEYATGSVTTSVYTRWGVPAPAEVPAGARPLSPPPSGMTLAAAGTGPRTGRAGADPGPR